jgi:hypothetical protein
MIELFRERLPDQEAFVADMRMFSLQRVFPGVLAWDSFFHLNHDDQRRMFPIFRAHAAPRAALMLTSGPAYGEDIGQLEGEPLYHASWTLRSKSSCSTATALTSSPPFQRTKAAVVGQSG